MARYVLLRIEDDREADDLLRDVALYPRSSLLTPTQENAVSVEVVPDIDPSDYRAKTNVPIEATNEERARGLRAVLRKSYLRASELAAEWEAAS
ncbi:MAG: hypothetical protein L0I24_16680 [Pseudonocardia sp.]|nr:hypothetical protein [Pseudonocardia sp.]